MTMNVAPEAADAVQISLPETSVSQDPWADSIISLHTQTFGRTRATDGGDPFMQVF